MGNGSLGIVGMNPFARLKKDVGESKMCMEDIIRTVRKMESKIDIAKSANSTDKTNIDVLKISRALFSDETVAKYKTENDKEEKELTH